MTDWFKENLGDDIANHLFTIKVPLSDGKFAERDLRPDVTTDYDKLEIQLEEMPAIYATWGMLLAESKKEVAAVERMIKRRRGEVTRELLDVAKQEGARTRREDVEDMIEADEKINEFEAKLIIANRRLSKLFAATQALAMKSDNLRSLAGFKRQEQRDP